MTHPWLAPAAARTEPDRIAEETTALTQLLDYQRATLLTKCAGLTAAQLRHPAVPPSRLTLLGLVRHLTEVERWWLRMHAAGGERDLGWPHDPDQNGADFIVDGADAQADLVLYSAEVEAARAAVAGVPLDQVVPSLADHPERTRDFRWILLHMIEEYARHNGHADLLREAIDGTTGD